jgi:hypothetical protein
MGFKPDFRSKNDDLPDNYNSLPARERERLMKERVRLLHVYGQYCWHSECRIVGNKNALIVLRDAIDDAIKRGKSETGAMTSDGEGYSVEVEMCDADWDSDKWERQPMPYTAEHARS